MKLPGVVLMLVCCAGIGMYAAANLRNQVRIYQNLLLFLEDCLTYMQYQRLNLEELFQLAAGKESYQHLEFVRELNPVQGIPPETLWKQALEKSRLPEEARRILSVLGGELGKTDLQGQIAVLTLCRSQMRTALEACQADSAQKAQLYQSLGWLGGAVCAVLFL